MSPVVVVMVGGVTTSLLMVVLIGLLARAQYRREHGVANVPSAKDCSVLLVRARALDEAAAAALEAAQRAATTYEQIARDLAVAESEREAAWQAHSEAVAAHLAAQNGDEADPVEPAISDLDQKDISAAARAAYRRGEISVEELRAVWQRVGGWDESQDDRAHQLSRLRAEETEAWRRYHAASFAERTAQHAAELAEAAARALTDDAAEAARQAELARLAAEDCIARAKRRR